MIYVKAMMCAQKVNTRELVHCILSTARHVSNVILLCKIIHCMVTGVRKYIQTDGGDVQQLCNLTLHLTTSLSKYKCTSCFFAVFSLL